jgi:hypothetical protein
VSDGARPIGVSSGLHLLNQHRAGQHPSYVDAMPLQFALLQCDGPLCEGGQVAAFAMQRP